MLYSGTFFNRLQKWQRTLHPGTEIQEESVKEIYVLKGSVIQVKFREGAEILKQPEGRVCSGNMRSL